MKNQLRLLICILALVSCNSEHSSKSQNKPESKKEEFKALTFDHFISDTISDSSKTVLLKDWVTKINLDTALEITSRIDTAGTNIYGYYRNDSLIKIVRGDNNDIGMINYSFMRYKSTAYYFLVDSLIAFNYYCSSYQQTGRCNPVEKTKTTYFYKNRIIHEEASDNIRMYHSCGCGMSFEMEKQLIKVGNPIDSNDVMNYYYSEVNRLKTILNSDDEKYKPIVK